MAQGAQHESAVVGMGQASPPQPAEAPEVLHLLAALEAQFGERWDDADRARVREQLAKGAVGGAALSDRALANGDEPDFVFHPYRGV